MSTHTNKTIQQICDEDTGDSSLITNLVRRGKELEEENSKMLTDWLIERAIFTKQIESLREDKVILDWYDAKLAPHIGAMRPLDDDADRRTIYWVMGYNTKRNYRTPKEAMRAAMESDNNK